MLGDRQENRREYQSSGNKNAQMDKWSDEKDGIKNEQVRGSVGVTSTVD